jgi:hypothetical protein
MQDATDKRHKRRGSSSAEVAIDLTICEFMSNDAWTATSIMGKERASSIEALSVLRNRVTHSLGSVLSLSAPRTLGFGAWEGILLLSASNVLHCTGYSPLGSNDSPLPAIASRRKLLSLYHDTLLIRPLSASKLPLPSLARAPQNRRRAIGKGARVNTAVERGR